MELKKNNSGDACLNHNVTLIGRSQLSVSGVDDVESFDETMIVLHTCGGIMLIRGERMKIERLSIDGGDLQVTGFIIAIEYEEERAKGGFFSRLMK
jgi:sporulation protein YabP